MNKSYPNNYRYWLICGSHEWKRKVQSFKFLLHREHPKPATPIFFMRFYTGKIYKSVVLAWSSRFRALKPSYSNINARKALSLILVSNLYDHALTLDHTKILILMKYWKMLFWAWMNWDRTLKVRYSNINASKAFRLFLVPNLYDHALTLDHTQDPYTHEILEKPFWAWINWDRTLKVSYSNIKVLTNIHLVSVSYLWDHALTRDHVLIDISITEGDGISGKPSTNIFFIDGFLNFKLLTFTLFKRIFILNNW